jgi:hypothetical protein
MLIGTLFTLFVLPSVYLLLASTRRASTEEESDGETTAPALNS